MLTGWTSQTLIFLCLGGCSVLGVAIFLERLFVLNRSERDVHTFLFGLKNCLQNRGLAEAIHHCEQTGGAISTIVRAGLSRLHLERDRIEGAMESSANVEVANLERNAHILSMIAHIAPLLGLLGTVLGFIQVFHEIRLSGLVDISTTQIGSAMESALLSTAAGLVVAIPAVIAYNFLSAKIQRMVIQMEATSQEAIEILQEGAERY